MPSKKKKKKKPESEVVAKLKRPKVSLDERAIVALLFVVAFVIRLLYLYHLKSNSPVYGLLIHDSALFNHLGQEVAGGKIIGDQQFYISPLYIYFIGLIYSVLGEGFNYLRLVQFILGSTGCVVLYFLARRMFDRRVAIVASLVAAVYGPFLFFEGNILGTSLVVLLFLCAVYLLVLTIEKGGRWYLALLSGIMFSLGVTGRPNLLLVIPIPVVYILLNPRPNSRVRFLLPAIWVLGISIPLSLTVLHNYLAAKDLSLITSHGGINFYIGNHKGASGVWEAPKGLSASVSAINLEESRDLAERELGRKLDASEVSSYWYGRAFRYILHHPGSWLGLMSKKFMLFWSGYETPLNFDYYFHNKYSPLLRIPFTNFVFIVPLALFGLIVYAKEWKKRWLLYALILAGCISVVAFFMADRYRLPIVPFLLIFASAGAFWLLDHFRSGLSKHVIYAVLGLIALYVMVVWQYRDKRAHTHFANDCYNLSLAYIIDDKPKAAIYWGRRAVMIDPTLKDAHYNLGVAHLQVNEQEQALQAFQKVVVLDSTDVNSQLNVGGILLMQGKSREALPHLSAAVRYDSTSIKALMNLGLAYYYEAKYQRATKQWEKILKIEPGNEQAKNNIKAARAKLY